MDVSIEMQRLFEATRSAGASEDVLRHFRVDGDRIAYMLERLSSLELSGKRVCEVGFGGVGLACHHLLGAEVDACDVSERFRGICDHFGIRWSRLDLHESAVLFDGPYDLILLCEVIEHLNRWPVEILSELGRSLKEGGVLLVTTQNLHRLSNRLRMLAGYPLFANFTREELLMAHLREYTLAELRFLLQKAGFGRVDSELVCLPGGEWKGWLGLSYRMLCRMLPNLSNFLLCWAHKSS